MSLMRLHRFYIGQLHDKSGPLKLERLLWVNDENLVRQWTKVLRFQVGDEVVLFDGHGEDRLYRITKFEPRAAHLELITEIKRTLPGRELYLCFSLLKKDKNEWVLQKCTELGVSHFIPIITDRTEKTGWDNERAQKIVIEASEQCGRSDIPRLREPVSLESTLEELKDYNLLVCDKQEPAGTVEAGFSDSPSEAPIVLFVGPEGGWSENDHEVFRRFNVRYFDLGQLTLRAETACVAAVTKLIS